jgi:hypothetical protein
MNTREPPSTQRVVCFGFKKEKNETRKKEKISTQKSRMVSNFFLGVPVPRPTQCMGGA